MRSETRRRTEVACVLAGIAILVALIPLGDTRDTALVTPLALVTCLPWLWHDRFPTGTLVIQGAGLVACILVLHVYDWSSAVAVVLLFLVALEGDRRRSVVVGVATAAILAGVLIALIPVLDRGISFSEAMTRVLAALSALVVGDLIRSRRALQAAQSEKTAREIEDLRRHAENQTVAERLRIARELHDTLAHALVAINVRAGVTAHLGVPPQASEALLEIKNVSAQALTDLRGTLDVLRDPDAPAARNPSLGLAAVPRLVARAEASGLRTASRLEIAGSAIPSVVDQAGFRIVQESLTNIIRHAQASHAWIRIARTAELLVIEITDDGKGQTTTNPDAGQGTGHGLQGMAERAAAVGGTISAGPGSDRGWRVLAALPLREMAT